MRPDVELHVDLALGRGLARGGHHGIRILAGLLILVAILALVVWLVRRQRQRRERTHRRGPRPPSPPTGAALPTTDTLWATPPTPTPITARQPRQHGSAAAISARALSKRYGPKVAVDGLSFDVHPGRVTGFLGPNGAGKSTTMRMIMGLDAPSGGTVTINGRRYHDLAWPLREVGALLEARAIHPGRTAHAHLRMLAQTNHIPPRRVDEVLGLVGLSEVAHQRAGQFSLGMGQRLGMAAALLGHPGVLLFDEPVNGLDTDGIRWVRQLLRGLAAEGRTVFVSSHLMSEMAMTADHVVVIARGRLIADLPTAEFTARYTHSAVRVRSPHLDRLIPALTAAGGVTLPDNDSAITVTGLGADEIGDLACRDSIALHELAVQTATLEEAFVESTEGQLDYTGGPALAHSQVHADRATGATPPGEEQPGEEEPS